MAGAGGALIALATTPFLPPGVPIILAAPAALAGRVGHRRAASGRRRGRDRGRRRGGRGRGGPVTAVWAAVLATAAGCYGLKLAGLVVPPRLLERPLARRFAELVPVALLAALIAVQALTSGQSLQADPARLAGMAAAVAGAAGEAPRSWPSSWPRRAPPP